jgi:copper resistance protein C
VPTHSRTALAGAVLLGGAIVLQALAAAPASAHDELISTDPAAGSTVATVPSVVVLTFAEPPLTLGLGVDVTGPGGTVSSGAPTLSGSVIRQAIRPGGPAGFYTVRWRVTADDGHPVSGSFTFAASAPGAAAPSGSPVAATTATAVANPASSNADDRNMPSPLLWWGIVGAAVVLVVAAATVAVTRRRRGAGADEPDRPEDVADLPADVPDLPEKT